MLREYTVQPGSIDTSSSAQTVTATARVTDDVAGVTGVQARAQNAGQSYGPVTLSRVSGTDRDGVYRGTFTIPRSAARGTYATSLAMQDSAGNNRSL